MNNLTVARLANCPVMVGSNMALWMTECMAGAMSEMTKIRARQDSEQEPIRMMDDFWPEEDSWLAIFRPYTVVDGTLLIPVKGMLLHDFGYQVYDWATGYTYVRRAFERGMADPAVQRIAMVISSSGGEVAGNFDLVDALYAMRGVKPIRAFVNESAYSAAFSIASVADSISMTRTAGVGSVGVVTSHVDYSKMLDKIGINFTYIFAGDHKVDGNPYEPLPAEVQARIQARVDGLKAIFVATVARNLGITEQAVTDTQAQCYTAEEAVAIGFAHSIEPFDEALTAFSRIQGNTNQGVVTMSQPNQTPEAAETGLDAARAEGRKEGAQAERERIQGILACDEAKNRRDLAFHLSMNTDLSVDAAKAILTASPEVVQAAASTAAPGADFAAAMSKDPPNLGADGGSTTELSPAQQLISDYKAATGFGS